MDKFGHFVGQDSFSLLLFHSVHKKGAQLIIIGFEKILKTDDLQLTFRLLKK